MAPASPRAKGKLQITESDMESIHSEVANVQMAPAQRPTQKYNEKTKIKLQLRR